jgi:hypothetical protein
LFSQLLVSDTDGRPLAPLVLRLQAQAGVFSSQYDGPLPPGAVTPCGRIKGKRGSLCGLAALRPTWGLEKGGAFHENEGYKQRDHAVPVSFA